MSVFFPFILDIKFVGRTSRGHTGGRSHKIFHPSFCGACLNFSREKDSAIPFFPRRPLSRILCVLTIQSFSTRWAFLFWFFSFLVRKIPFAGVELMSQRVRALRGTSELPGRPVSTTVVSEQISGAERSGSLFLKSVKSWNSSAPLQHILLCV